MSLSPTTPLDQPDPNAPDPQIALFERSLNAIVTQHVLPSIDQEKITHYLTIRRNDAYYKGQHYIAPRVTGGFADYAPVSGSSSLTSISRTADSPPDYTANVYRGDMNKLVAVIGQRSPNPQGTPRVPGNEAQVSRAKLAEQVAFILRTAWQSESRQPELVYSLGAKGTTFSYTPVVASRDKYGTSTVPRFEDIPVPTGPPTFLCESCGAEGEVGDMPAVYSDSEGMCPNCGSNALIAPPVQESLPQQVGEDEYTNWAVELHIVAGDRVITPFPVRDLTEAPWLIYHYEEDEGTLLQAFPILRDRSRLRSTLPATHTDRDGSETRAQLAAPFTNNTQYLNSKRKLFSRIWLRPSMFEYIQDDSQRAQLHSSFPNGLKITAVDGYIVQLEPERIDDVWAACKPTAHEYLWQTGYMDDMIQCNDIVDDFITLVVELVMRSVPLNIADPKIIDKETIKRKGRNIAEFIWARQQHSGNFKDAVHTLQLAKPDPQLMALIDNIVDIFRQITGITPPIFGGGAYKTAREAELNRNQALAALSVLWNSIRNFWSRTYENGVRQLARYATNGKMYMPKSHPDDENEVEIPDLSEVLKGGWTFSCEESFPMTPGQIQDKIMSILELNNDVLIDKLGIFHPASLSGIDTTLAIPGIKIAGKDDYQALMEIINQLVESQPIQSPVNDPLTGVVIDMEMAPAIAPDTFRFDPMFAAEVVRQWANSPEGLAVQRENEQGYFHALLYGMKYKELAMAQQTVQGAAGGVGEGGGAPGEGLPAAEDANALQPASAPEAQNEQMPQAA